MSAALDPTLDPAGEFGAALGALDTLLAIEMQRLRARYTLSLDEFRGLFVSDAMVDALLAREAPPPVPVNRPLLVARLGVPVRTVAARLRLCPLGSALLTLALAPELDARYPTLFAYLNDDVSRRWPTLDLAQRLLLMPGDAAGARRLRAHLGATGIGATRPDRAGGLVSLGLLVPATQDEASRPQLLQGWRAALAVPHHLLGLPGHAMPGLRLLQHQPPAQIERLPDRIALVVFGPRGCGAAATAAAWAARFGKAALLHTPDPSPDLRPDSALPDQLRQAGLTARLLDALLVVDARPLGGPLPLAGLDPTSPVVVLAETAAGWSTALAPRLVLTFEVGMPDLPRRAGAWQAALAARGLTAPTGGIERVAGQFQLTEGAIERAAERVRLGRSGRGGASPAPAAPASATAAELLAAARDESAVELGPLARPVRLTAGWDDLVLTQGALRQLQDFAAAIALRGRVFGAWGFGGVGRATGEGLAALFSGGSGTGKTMSAAVIAGELGFDLWRIDLAATVSKYIGETEKNLDRLFSAAGTANAILFFDEADALFGRRSEVKDSHDRYANIEIAYLLQRLEEHPGVVILATNLSRNLDSAFLRRLPFVIDFPMPDPAARVRLWRKAIPAAAPLSGAVDFTALAQRFELSGGDIRTAALEAAFLAAATDRAIDPEALDIAIRRQLMKRGQLPAAVPARAGTGAQPPPNGAGEVRHGTA